jgi:hypothetical protein
MMTVRVLVLSALALLVSVHQAVAGPTYPDRASWAAAVGGIVVTENFDGFPQNHSANPLPVAWGEVQAEFGQVFVHPFAPAGGLSLGAINYFLVPTNASTVRGFAFRALGSQFSQVAVTISDGSNVLLQTTVTGGTFFGWQRGPNEGFARVTVSSLGGLVEIDDVEFAAASPVETAILTNLDVPVSTRASQESLDALAAAVVTDADLSALAATINALDAKVTALQAATVILGAKVDAICRASGGVTEALRFIAAQLVEIRRRIDALDEDTTNGRGGRR